MQKLIVLFLAGIMCSTCTQTEQKFLETKDAYFGQKPPGLIPEVFAPGVISLPDRLESSIVFSPDGQECYLGIIEIKDNKASYKIYYTQYVNNKWTEQQEVPFSVNNNVSSPFVSADGERLYFAGDGDIWLVERTLGGWGEPQLLPAPINSDSRDDSYTETADGTIYINSKRIGGFGNSDNWRITQLSDQPLQAENLGPILNSSLLDYSPFIAPDGSYLIFGSYRNGKHGQADLFISFNDGNDWTTPVNMNSCGTIINNNTAHHSEPSLSPDGKYLFFRRHETMMDMDVYWVDAKIIEEIRAAQKS